MTLRLEPGQHTGENEQRAPTGVMTNPGESSLVETWMMLPTGAEIGRVGTEESKVLPSTSAFLARRFPLSALRLCAMPRA